MQDVKGREVQVGDIIWVGRRHRNFGELVRRKVLDIREDGTMQVQGWGRVLVRNDVDNGWHYEERAVRPSVMSIDSFIIDVDERQNASS